MHPKSVIAVITLMLATQVFAQEDAVVVIATRFPEKQLEFPIGVTIINREQIANSTATNLPDLLSRYAGINTRNSSGSPDVSIDMRGFGMSGDQNTLVLLDGQRMDDIELTSVRWSSIPLDAVERVEIERGGGAVLYGAGATGGTINIITRSPIAGEKNADVAADYGSYNTAGVHAGFNLAGNNTGFALDASQDNSDNYRANNRLEQGNVLGDLRWTGERAGLVFKFGLDQQSLRLPGALTAAQLSADPRATYTPNDYSKRDGAQGALSGRYQFDAFELAADLSHRDVERDAFFDNYSGPLGQSSYLDTHTKVWAFNPRVKLPYRLFGRDNALVFGMDADIWDYRSLRAPTLATLGTPTANLAATQKDRAFYAQNSTALGAATKLTLGARVQHYQIEADDRANAQSAASANQTRTPRAWDAALRHNLTPALALYGKLGASFRFATVDEIYSQYGVCDPVTYVCTSAITPLEPQTSHDKEIGAEYRAGGTHLRASLYRMDLRNEIHYNAVTFTNMNLSPTRREGFELEGSTELGKRVALFGSYTYARAVFREGVYNGFDSNFNPINVNLSGKNVPLVPRNSAKLGLSWSVADKTSLSGSLSYVGRQYFDNDQSNTYPGQMAPYVTADAKLSHVAGPWTVSLAGNNLADRKYYTYAIRNGAGTSFNAYPMPGRNLLLTAAYRWKWGSQLRRAMIIWLFLALAALAALALALSSGSARLPPLDLLHALLTSRDSLAGEIVTRLRLPRALAAFAVGGLLALAGALMQVLLRNPLADPYVLGVSGGAAVGALGAMFVGMGAFAVDLGASVGALAATALVFAFARRDFTRRQALGALDASPRLLLTGVILAAGWGALITLTLTLAPDARLRGMLFWLMGDLNGVESWAPALITLALALALSYPAARELNVLLRGEVLAHALGVRVAPLRRRIYLIASVATALAVTTAGAIGFVGLVVPHALRLALGNDQRMLLPASVLAGGTLLLLADTAARSVLAPQQLPVGVITALIGVPAFLFLLTRSPEKA